MTHDEWIATVVLDLNEQYDLANRWQSGTLLAEKWWRMMHPLCWQDEEVLLGYDFGEGEDETALVYGMKDSNGRILITDVKLF